MEHLVEPFFVLQLFTSALFAIDESPFYSLLGLFMLFMCEF